MIDFIVVLESFARGNSGKEIRVKKVVDQGTEEPLEWEMTDRGLSVTFPGDGMDDMAAVIRVETNGLE